MKTESSAHINKLAVDINSQWFVHCYGVDLYGKTLSDTRFKNPTAAWVSILYTFIQAAQIQHNDI